MIQKTGTTSLCTTSDFLRLDIFGHSLAIIDLWPRPWGLPDYWDSAELIRALIPRNGSGKLPPPPPQVKR